NVTITVEQLPVINAGTNATICSDQSSFTLSSASGPATGVAYQWLAIGGNGSLNNPTLLNPTYTIDSNDTSITFQLTAQNNLPGDNCPAVTDEIVLTIEELVSVSAGANGSICATGYLLNSATAANATSVLWSTNGTGTFSDNSALQPVYTPSAADVLSGSVDLTLTATNNCGSDSNTITKTIVDTPTVNAGIDITISQGATADLSGITTNASSVLWTFTGGSGTLINPTDETSAQYITDPTELGPITLTLTAQPIAVNGVNCGSEVVDTLIISINPTPIADAGPDRAICLNEITQLGTASTPGYSYEWTSVPTDSSISDPLSSNPNVSPSITTEYTVTVTDDTGETAEDSVIVTVNPLPVVEIGSDDTICVGESIQLGAPAPGGFSYAWTSIPAGFTSTLADPIVAPIVTTQYFLTVTTDVTGCQDTADLVITVENPPVIDAGTDDTICEDQ
ncbi:MAG: hypothetical protein GY893_04305, partial [bacterium]|nr:hypothetical protein [bacterium]